MGIKDNISRLLEEKDMTVTQLCKDTGLAPTTVYSIMQRDSDSITINTLRKLSKAFGVEIWDLIGVSPEAAKEAGDANEVFEFLLDDEEYERNKFLGDIYEEEKRATVDCYYSSIVPILKNLGYRSNLFMYNTEWTIILRKNDKEQEMSFKEMKAIISDVNYIADYFVSKSARKISSQTKERRDALRNSPTKKTSVYVPAKPEDDSMDDDLPDPPDA